MLLSLFCGAGGLDLGFERAGFSVGMAFDVRPDSIQSYNLNRQTETSGETAHGRIRDVRTLTPETLDILYGGPFLPRGVIGGPPCQSFSRANVNASEDDPRHELPRVYAELILALNERSPLDFFVFENVPGLNGEKHIHRFQEIKTLLEGKFNLGEETLNAIHYLTPQKRERLFLVGFNKEKFPDLCWTKPEPTTKPTDDLSVAKAFEGLPEPVHYSRGLKPEKIPYHRNHWCMAPKSKRFTSGELRPGDGSKRSFKTLAWGKPSITVAYGHREVHVHPNCKRRLSVYEGMILQGFPRDYVLFGSLSSQITQVSEAVPPRMAEAVARSISDLLNSATELDAAAAE